MCPPSPLLTVPPSTHCMRFQLLPRQNVTEIVYSLYPLIRALKLDGISQAVRESLEARLLRSDRTHSVREKLVRGASQPSVSLPETLNELLSDRSGETGRAQLIWIVPAASFSLPDSLHFRVKWPSRKCATDWPNGWVMERRERLRARGLFYMPAEVMREMRTEVFPQAVICLARRPVASLL